MSHQDDQPTIVSARRPRLLFVDADARVLNSLRAQFRQEYDVVVANQVHEALQALEDAPVDVIVSDDQLPDTTGLDLLQWVQARAPHAARILLVAAGEQPYSSATIRRARLFRVLPRPCDPELLRVTIAQGERSARLEREEYGGATGGGQLPADAANDQPDLRHSRGTSATVAAGNSGVHRTLDGADRTVDRPEDTSRLATLPPYASSSPQGGSAPDAAPHHPEDELDRPTSTRIWSADGIIVEEDAYEDPTHTREVIASMLKQRQARQRAGESSSSGTSGSSEAHALPPAHEEASDALAQAPGARKPPQRAAHPADPITVLVVSDDAITRAQLARNLRGTHRPLEAKAASDALDAVCSSECGVVLLDARRLSPVAVERRARLLLSAAPDLGILVVAEMEQSAAFAQLPERLDGAVSLLLAVPTPEQLLDAVAWANASTGAEALAPARQSSAPTALPARDSHSNYERPRPQLTKLMVRPGTEY